MTKRILLHVWQALSVVLLSLVIFQSGDELLTRREGIVALSAVLAACLLTILSFRILSEKDLTAGLTVSAFIAFLFCLGAEYVFPLPVYLKTDIRIDIEASPQSPAELIWAYWSSPDRDMSDEVEYWPAAGDISHSDLAFQGEWDKSETGACCMGGCSLTLKKALSFHRPVFSFLSPSVVTLRNGSEFYSTTPNTQLRFFAAGKGISRQSVFALLFLSLIGVLCIPAAVFRKALRRFDGKAGSSFMDSDWFLYPASFFIPVVILFAVCLVIRIFPFGEKTFLISDMQAQYIDYLLYFRNVLNGSKSLFYSFSKSIGDDFLSLYAYYLGNPLNWLSALFPIGKYPIAAELLIMLRYGLCGLTSALYFRKVFHTKRDSLIFSTAYALIAFHFVICEHIQLRDGAVLLPVILLGIDQLISRESGKLYIAALCGMLLVNYYSAYQICFFCVLYFVFRVLLDNSFSRKKLLSFGCCSFISAGFAAFLLIPVAIQLTKGMKSVDGNVISFAFNMSLPELAGKLFYGSFDLDQTLTSGLPNIFCGTFVTVGLPLFFLNRNIRGKEKLLGGAGLLLCAAVMMIRGLNLILHGFTEPVWWPYRYSYIICLFLLSLVLRCWKEREGITLPGAAAAAVFVYFLLWIAAGKQFSWFSAETVRLNVLLAGCMLLVWAFSARSASGFPLWVLIFCCADLFLNGWMILGEKNAYQRSETPADFQAFFSDNIPLIRKLKDSDDGFYRVEKTYARDANDAMTLDYHGVAHYSSTLNYELMKFLPKMGYRYFPWRFLYGEGSDLAADSLLGIRYIISDSESIEKPYEPVFTENGYTVFRNPYSLPFSFAAEQIATDDPAHITFELQNDIFTALTGSEDAVYNRIAEGTPVLHNLRLFGAEPGIYERIDAEQEASITWNVSAGTEDALYLYLRNDADLQYPLDLFVNGELLMTCFDGTGNPIIPLPSGLADLEITLRLQADQAALNELQIYSENLLVLEKYAGQLQQSSVAVRKDSETAVSGTISAEKAGYLFFTIPYDRGWRIEIDGSPAAAEKAFGLFLSAPVSAGIHTFSIKYRPEGLLAGCAVSGGTLILLGMAAMIRKKRAGSVR